jgi:hypothetical protein
MLAYKRIVSIKIKHFEKNRFELLKMGQLFSILKTNVKDWEKILKI